MEPTQRFHLRQLLNCLGKRAEINFRLRWNTFVADLTGVIWIGGMA